MFIPAQSLDFEAVTADISFGGGKGLLVGWAVQEPTGAAVASFIVRDGLSATAPPKLPITLLANQSTRDFLPMFPIAIERGVFLDVTAGTVTGALYFIPQNVIDTPEGRWVWTQTEPGYGRLD